MGGWLFEPISEAALKAWEAGINTWVVAAALVWFGAELAIYAQRRRLGWRLIGDALTNTATFLAALTIAFLLFGAAYMGALFAAHGIALFDIPITVGALTLCVLAVDFAYYWEHRFSHRAGLAWATHLVHHSSPYYNISVANRFGPMDGFWTVFFHAPLAFIGFHPLLIVFCQVIVLQYQTFLHTETIRKLPAPIEWVMNTPSHHRVHHGSNPAYIDKNYGGVFILWDRLFGTFAEEREPVAYGLVQPEDSINPLAVFFRGFERLIEKIKAAPGFGAKIACLAAPPEWAPHAKAKD